MSFLDQLQHQMSCLSEATISEWNPTIEGIFGTTFLGTLNDYQKRLSIIRAQNKDRCDRVFRQLRQQLEAEDSVKKRTAIKAKFISENANLIRVAPPH